MRKTILLLLTMCSMGAWAVNIEYCQQKAVENYPLIKQYDLIGLTEKYSVQNANNGWIPQIAFSAQATWQTDVASFPEALTNIMKMVGTDIPGMRQDQYKLALDIYQHLWDGGASTAGRKIEHAKAAEQRYSTDVELYKIEERVNNIYFAILLLEEQQKQSEYIKELLNSNLDLMKSMVKNGVALQADADALEVEMLTAMQHIDQLQVSSMNSRQVLSILIGEDLTKVEFEKPVATEVAMLQENVRPEQQLFNAKSKLLQAQRSAIMSASQPRLGLFAQGWYGYPGLNMFENMMNSNWSWNAVVGVKLQWSLTGFYTQRNKYKNIEYAQQQIELQRDAFNLNNTMESSRERNEIIRLKKAVEDDERIVELRKSIRQTAESKLKNGTINTIELLNYITDESKSLSAKSLHQTELLKAVYELNHTLGLTYKEYSKQ